MSSIPFTNFTKGEISPELQARIDTQQYGAAAKRVRNFIIQRYGGLSFRPGFRLVGEADSVEDDTKYIPFQFNIEQAYIMVLQDENMKLLANAGKVVEENLKITAITKAANAQITAALHGYVVGEKIALSGIEGMTELNGREVTVMSVVDDDNYTIDVDTTSYSTFISSDGVVRTVPYVPPVPPAPPPAPPAQPDPPVVAGGGGSGYDVGRLDKRSSFWEEAYDG